MKPTKGRLRNSLLGFRLHGRGHNRCTGVQVYRCTGVQVYRCTGVQVYRCTGVHVYRCTCVQVYRCTGVQVYRCTGVDTSCLVLPGYIWGRRHLLQVLEIRVVILPGDLKSSFRFSLDEVMQILDATNVIGQILGTQDWFHGSILNKEKARQIPDQVSKQMSD